MKKLVAVLAIVAFLGGMSAPIIANDNASLTVIELTDKDPKKAEKKSDKKAADCATKESAQKKSSDCTAAKKSPCEKTCGDKK
jgi:hypothetical protein